uniref:Ig-like domain-containing protein n=1 Tax=Amphilophus citrinellus TaxID=61819 RepID=A0A3Q0QNC3_AMPCI
MILQKMFSGLVSITLLLFLMFPGSSGEIILTQTPEAQSVVPGQTVSIRCKSSTLIGDDINWYLQKSGEALKLLIYDTTARQSGVPDHFRATAVQTDFTLIISGVQAEDAGVYYCQQHNKLLVHTVNHNDDTTYKNLPQKRRN